MHRVAVNVAHHHVGPQGHVVPAAPSVPKLELRLLGQIDVGRHMRRVALARRGSSPGPEMNAVDLEALVDHDPPDRGADCLKPVEEIGQHSTLRSASTARSGSGSSAA